MTSLKARPLAGSLNPQVCRRGAGGDQFYYSKAGPFWGQPDPCYWVLGLTWTGSPKWIWPSDSTRGNTLTPLGRVRHGGLCRLERLLRAL